ncbi:MAG: hypothetical protein M0P12_10950 [Paludibacteraceae bacterium]|jgi:hypothetical protein|nr:hypothetical protein [Paludibacteraceae bacterium]
MKILLINNYSIENCLNKANEGVQPAHHKWGSDYLKSKGNDVDTEVFNLDGVGIIKKQI